MATMAAICLSLSAVVVPVVPEVVPVEAVGVLRVKSVFFKAREEFLSSEVSALKSL